MFKASSWLLEDTSRTRLEDVSMFARLNVLWIIRFQNSHVCVKLTATCNNERQLLVGIHQAKLFFGLYIKAV